jgi:hypothetical protein
MAKCKQFYWGLFPKYDQLDLKVYLAKLRVRNRLSKKMVVSPGGEAVISLTTYGDRVDSVYLTIESIGAGTVRPRRLILWLDKEIVPRPEIDRLIARGLEVRMCDNFGPHTKYYPYIETESALDLPLVTADDDVIYPSFWLQLLIEAYKARPDLVNCYRARDIVLTDTWLAPYLNWPLTKDCVASSAKMATGVSGVIYPMSLQRLLKANGREFMKLCPKADDLWLHVIALRNEFKIRQLAPVATEFHTVPGSQAQALCATNQFLGGNDRQINKTYDQDDFWLLKSTAEKVIAAYPGRAFSAQMREEEAMEKIQSY